MSRYLPLILALSMLSSSPAWAARKVSPMAETLENIFKIYTINKDRRSERDRIQIRGTAKNGYQAIISYWRSVASRESAEEICNAYRWLLLGRGAYGKGAQEAFRQIRSLNEIQLHFYDVEYSTQKGKKRGVILPSQKVIPYLRIGVQRNSLQKKDMDLSKVDKMISKGQCSEVGRLYLDTKWFDEKHLRKAR